MATNPQKTAASLDRSSCDGDLVRRKIGSRDGRSGGALVHGHGVLHGDGERERERRRRALPRWAQLTDRGGQRRPAGAQAVTGGGVNVGEAQGRRGREERRREVCC